jgi:hypothetical protein
MTLAALDLRHTLAHLAICVAPFLMDDGDPSG